MTFKLDQMSLKDLKTLHADVTKAIAEFDSRKKREALAQLEAKAREMGFGLHELLGTAPAKKSRASATAKYAHPAQPSVTWSGRGRAPKWFTDALAAGKSREELAV